MNVMSNLADHVTLVRIALLVYALPAASVVLGVTMAMRVVRPMIVLDRSQHVYLIFAPHLVVPFLVLKNFVVLVPIV